MEEASKSEQVLLTNRGFIFERDTKMLKDLGKEATEGKELVKVVVANKGEDDGGVVDGKR